jgi:hypothetical protein
LFEYLDIPRRSNHGRRAQKHRMRNVRVKKDQGTFSLLWKSSGSAASDLVLEHDSAMKDDRLVRSAKNPDESVQATPAN